MPLLPKPSIRPIDVVVFPSRDLPQLLETVRPDILTKGSNYASDEVLGKQQVEQYGGRVSLIPINEKISSTQIIDRIKNHHDKD